MLTITTLKKIYIYTENGRGKKANGICNIYFFIKILIFSREYICYTMQYVQQILSFVNCLSVYTL